MSTIVVVGAINHDRIWRTDGPLLPGARLSFTGPEVRLGGGAFSSGSVLRELGHEVVLVAGLMKDEHGLAALDLLVRRGFDTRHVVLFEGETPMVEILVDPAGERTILHRRGSGKRVPALRLERPDADAAYLNTYALPPGLAADLEALPLVMMQYPLRSMEMRPVDVLIGSRADLGGEDEAALWRRGRSLATERLSSLVLTDGPGPIRLIDGDGVRGVLPAQRLALSDTTGAGDYFAAAYLHGLVTGLGQEAAAFQASEITARRLLARENGARAADHPATALSSA